MQTFKVSDIGSIAIVCSDMVNYFRNYVGDGENIVNICTEEEIPSRVAKDPKSFIGMFDSRSNEIYLSRYDCDFNEHIYIFDREGRYFVYLDMDGYNPVFYITWRPLK
jgi:hypothetical protein